MFFACFDLVSKHIQYKGACVRPSASSYNYGGLDHIVISSDEITGLLNSIYIQVDLETMIETDARYRRMTVIFYMRIMIIVV